MASDPISGTGGTCPSNGRLAAAVAAEAPGTADRAVLAHALECPRCRRKAVLLEEIRTAAAPLVDGLPESLSRREVRRLRAGASAGTVGRRPAARPLAPVFRFAAGTLGTIAVIAAGFFAVERAQHGGSLRSGGQLRLVSPPVRPTAVPVEFSWTPVDGGDVYRFSILDPDLNRVWETSLRGVRVALPKDVVARLVPGRTYLWSVEVTDDAAREIGRDSRSLLVPQGP